MLLILGSFFVQMMFVFGFLILYGMLISFFNNCFYSACGDKARPIVKLTGYIGIPVHELSHAAMCLLFGHSIKKIELFNHKKRAKILGYVEHTYYRDNPYHQLGNFFIGVSPILAGGSVILLFVRLLVPSLFESMTGEIAGIAATLSGGFSGDFFSALATGVGRIAADIFAVGNFAKPLYWLCLILIFVVAIHMEISYSDIRSGARGLLALAMLFLTTDLVLGFLFPNALVRFTEGCVMVGVYEALFLLVPAIFTAILGGISLLVRAFQIMFGEEKKKKGR